jgi:homoserine O-succinyltransferase
MPDSAVAATERQFSGLLRDASGDLDVSLSLFTLDSVPREPSAREAIARSYRGASALEAHGPDAIIVTGAEPKTPDLRQEPYWNELGAVFDWAEDHTVSVLFSCLAAHAAVLRRDNIARRRFPQKLSGVFTCDVGVAHELVEGLGPRVSTPHSRYNGLEEAELAAKGYKTLTRSEEAGPDIFVREAASLLVFLQGHPEYDADTLAREYRRDTQRFANGISSTPPAPPTNYQLSALGEPAWRANGVRLFGNWLKAIARRKAALNPPSRAVALSGG